MSLLAGGPQPGPVGRPWSRNARPLAFFLLVAALLLVLYAAHDLLGPLLIAAFVAYLFNPLVMPAIAGNCPRCRFLELDSWPAVDRVMEAAESEAITDEA